MVRRASNAAALIEAIKAGDFDRVKAMVSADAALLDARSESDESAILTAVDHRQKGMATRHGA